MAQMPESFQQAPSESSAQPGATAKAKVRDDRRVRWLLAAALLFMASTFLALRQSPWPYPYDPPRSFSVDWWLHPIERNAERRLPLVSSEINAVWVSDDGERMWAVGDRGLVLRSDDGGKGWQKVEIGEPVESDGAITNLWSWPGGTAVASPQSTPDNLVQTGPPQTISSEPPDQEQQVVAPPRLPPLPASWFEALRIGWDDANTFQPIADLPPNDFHAVSFRDESHGWIGGTDGYLLRTTDGGNSWQRRRLPGARSPVPLGASRSVDAVAGQSGISVSVASDERPTLIAIAFSGPDVGCALLAFRAVSPGRDSSVFASQEALVLVSSDDDGASWRLRTTVDTRSLLVRDDECWALDGDDLLIVERLKTERRPLPQTLKAEFERRGVFADSESPRVLVHSSGSHLTVSEDAGSTWRSTSRNSEIGLLSLHFFDRQHGIASTQQADGNSRIQLTEDGGKRWRAIESEHFQPVDLGFVSRDFGWAVDRSDRLFFSTDGGERWIERTDQDLTSPNPLVVHFSDPSTGFLIGADQVFTTRDGGINWSGDSLHTVFHYIDLAGLRTKTPTYGDLTDNLVVDALAADGHIYELREQHGGGAPLMPLAVRVPRPEARSIARVDGRLWVGGSNGLFIVGEDADERITDRPVLAFHFLDRETGWIAEPGGGLLFTEDGGINWTDLAPYRIFPAPWYWLACFVSLLLLAPAFRKPPAQEVHRSVAEMAVSDRPIEAGDPDPLDFGQVALGLSRFLRNSATQPPLTLAVTGKWGTGKSSLMNLLRADLARYGFRPVWFNAWHHQKEEQLLAALLVNIRRQAIPSLWSPEGWAFRGRLLARRMRRWRLLTLLLTLGFGVLTGWVATSGEGAGLMQRVAEGLAKLNPLEWLPREGGEALEPGMAAFLVAAAAVLFTVGRGLRAFGVDPGTLVAGLSSRASRRDARAQAGFRHRFAREFEDVTRALHPRTLTLLIDDLDRCRPQNVLDVLEAVNFLVSSGRCYVVLGIDREMVERFVGYGFREVAEEIFDRDDEPAEQGDAEAAGRARRAAFARQYLEKLINIEVAVPRVEEAAGRDLVRPPEPRTETRKRGQRLAGWIRSLPGRWWALPALLAVTLIVGLWLGSWFGKEPAPVVADTPAAAPAAVEPQAEPEVPGEDAVLGEEAPPAEITDDEQLATGPPARLIPGEEGDRHHLWFWLAVVVLLAAATIWVLTTLPQVEVHDSPEFVQALDAWFPLLHAETPTPRSIKRFLNRVRCYAMRQRPAEPPKTRWGAVGDWFRGLVGKPQETDNDFRERLKIPERALVALAAIEHVYPDLLRDPDFWTNPWATQVRNDQEGHSLSISEIVGSDLPEIFRYRRAFAGLSRGIETH